MKVTGAHTYHPRGQLLEARVAAYKTALEEYRTVQTSLSLSKDKNLSDTLGTPEEIDEARLIIRNSLDMAIAAIDASELLMIRQHNLLSVAEIEELKKFQQQRPSQGEKLTQD